MIEEGAVARVVPLAGAVPSEAIVPAEAADPVAVAATGREPVAGVAVSRGRTVTATYSS